MTSTGGSGLAVLRIRDFRLYLAARFLAANAAQMIVIAVGWQVYRMTGRTLDLGLIGLSQFLPFIVFALYAGHAADRFERRRILILCSVVQASCAGLLLAFTVERLAHTGPIFAVLAMLGVARAFQMPTAQSFMPNLVPTESLPRAIALSSSSFQVATIAGPSVGGILYSVALASWPRLGGAAAVYLAATLLLLASLGLLLRVRSRGQVAARTTPAGAADARDLLQGLRFVWRRKTVLGALSLDLFAVLFGGATALLPAFTRDVLQAGPAAFGYLRSAPGLGAGITAVALTFAPLRRNVGATMFLGVAVFGVSTIVFGLTHRFSVALVALTALGAGDMISVFIRHVLVQLETPDEIRGRVSAVNAMFIGASNELGEFESGLTAAWLGLVPAIVAGGAATLVVAALWAWVLFPP
ncbi:MAG: MFS transporter, partial [Gammaproteobacteria bacterium]|nr:MFS transporter [Gammaproteobacteria bacterium]